MQFAAFQPFADFRNRPRGVVMVGEVDLDVILRSGAPRTFLRKGMTRAGDDAPAGAGKADHGGMADAATGAGQKQRAPWGVGGNRHGDLSDFQAQGYRRVLGQGWSGAARRNSMRSCRRNGRSCQNSNWAGATRQPLHPGGRGTSPTMCLAATLAIACSKANRLSSGCVCLLAQAPIWACFGRVAK